MKYSYHVDVEYLCVVHYSISPGSSEAQARSYSRGLSPAKCCVMSQVQSDNYYRTDSIISTERQRSLSQDYHDQFVKIDDSLEYNINLYLSRRGGTRDLGSGCPTRPEDCVSGEFPWGSSHVIATRINFLTLTAIV